MNGVIEQEVRIEAPIERVRQVIADPAYVVRWFGTTAGIDLRSPDRPRGGWAESSEF